LTFVADAVPETAAHIDELLARARESDAAVANAAAAAGYAAGADPYRQPRTEDDEFADLDDT
jgi:ribosome-binding factor A